MLASEHLDTAYDTVENLDAWRPADWPGPGPIQLQIHDRPHASSSLEWWYVNCHLQTADGRELSIFAAFFRQLIGRDPSTGELRYAHSVSWALSEPATARYVCKVAVDANAPELGLAKLNAGAGVPDQRLNRALREVLEQGQIPGPTRMFGSEASVGVAELELDFGGDGFRKLSSGAYELTLDNRERGLRCKLSFTPRKAPVRFGDDGVVHGVADERMFYYYIPRCDVVGELESDGEQLVVSGSGWYDHEFGVSRKQTSILRSVDAREAPQTSWRWVSLQLDDGLDLSVYLITRGDEVLDNWTVLSNAEGGRQLFAGAELIPLKTWRSTRSFVEYPVAWRLELPAASLSLRIEAAFPAQEVLTVISDPGFWEGRVDAHGFIGETPVFGRGWVECKGFRFSDIESFFGAVGKAVRAQLLEVLPLEPSSRQIPAWTVRPGPSSNGSSACLAGIDVKGLAAHLAKPIRDITDRGGKAWRSYAALACIDVVGGDSGKFLHWLAIPELLHVGSLIVDDVEDESTIRRGGPACHVLHGVAQAINAGSAAYFLAEPPVQDDPISAQDKLRVYRYYFDAMRAGHAGQALDLAGCAPAAAIAAVTGETEQLEAQVLSIHRLKTAVPAGMLARIGAVLGGGTHEQVEGLGNFFESLGLAFQIIDDVLNLRGFEHDLKERGEDIRHGKLTLPIVKGLARLPLARRAWLWETLQSKPTSQRGVQEVIDALESTGAIDDCVLMAESHVRASWRQLDPLLESSQFKITFRAFAAFVLERHY